MVAVKQDIVYATCGYYHGDTFSTAHVHTFGIYTTHKEAHAHVGSLLRHSELEVKISPHSDSYISKEGVFWVKKLQLNKVYEEPVDMRVPDKRVGN